MNVNLLGCFVFLTWKTTRAAPWRGNKSAKIYRIQRQKVLETALQIDRKIIKMMEEIR